MIKAKEIEDLESDSPAPPVHAHDDEKRDEHLTSDQVFVIAPFGPAFPGRTEMTIHKVGV